MHLGAGLCKTRSEKGRGTYGAVLGAQLRQEETESGKGTWDSGSTLTEAEAEPTGWKPTKGCLSWQGPRDLDVPTESCPPPSPGKTALVLMLRDPKQVSGIVNLTE